MDFAKISKSNISGSRRRRTILTESHDLQMPLMDLLMASRSAADADQFLFVGKPRNGGGPLHSNSTASTYNGVGLRVDRFGRFEFPALLSASPACIGGAGLFTSSPLGASGVPKGGFGPLNRLVPGDAA